MPRPDVQKAAASAGRLPSRGRKPHAQTKVTIRAHQRSRRRLLTVLIEDHVLHSDEWSKGGVAFNLMDVEGYEVGQKIYGYLGGEPDEFLAFIAEVETVDEDEHQLALHFVEKGVRMFDYLDAVMMRRVLDDWIPIDSSQSH